MDNIDKIRLIMLAALELQQASFDLGWFDKSYEGNLNRDELAYMGKLYQRKHDALQRIDDLVREFFPIGVDREAQDA